MAKKLKRVISASRRTDIPAYYLDWFIDKVKQGFVFVDNPFYPGNERKINLSREEVSWIVFWSRNYSHFINKMDVFLDYNLFFHFTINKENEIISPTPYSLTNQIKQIETLCSKFSPNNVMWRFDPLFFYSQGSNYSPEIFNTLCFEMKNAGINQCTFSFAYPYKKIHTRIKKRGLNIEMKYLTLNEKLLITKELVEIASSHNIRLFSCCDDDLLKIPGIQKARCIDGKYLNTLTTEKVSVASYASRNSCGCTKSTDIGNYTGQKCKSRCLYCYARPGD